MSSAPSPPPAPDPTVTAQAQTGENVATAIANANLSHVNQTDQFGDTSTYTMNGTTPLTEMGQTYNIPDYTQSTTLSPANQNLYNTTLSAEQGLATAANTATTAAQSSLDNPVALQDVNLQELGPNALPNADLSANNINNFINTQWEQPLGVEQGQEAEQWQQSMADQGIPLNSTAYNQGQYNLGQTLQGQDDTYAANMYGTAANDVLGATSLQDQNALSEQSQNNSALLNQGQFNNQTALTEQNQPINEISALLGGSQIATPTFASTPQTTIPTTDYASIVQNTYQDQMEAYQQQVQSSDATNGGLFGLGGAVLGGLAKNPAVDTAAIGALSAI